MNRSRWVRARAGTALGLAARVVLTLGPLGGCGGEPAPGPLKGSCTGECSPGELLLGNGCCQPEGLPPDLPCPPGEWPRDNGECQPAGLPLDMPCPPGEWLRDDGGCQPAGVPPEDCGEGFAPDGEDGCNAILPPEACPKGQMAIPGETVCHEIAPCGSGDYGDIPVDPGTTQFVNQAFVGADSNGSEAKPWKTIQQGIVMAAPGAIVAVAAGTYAEDVTIQYKPVVLWGRCPALVEVAGTETAIAAVQVFDGSAGSSEIRALAITGLEVGLMVSGASDVVVDRVWIHDTSDRGLDIEDAYGQTSVTVTASLIEATHDAGAFVFGSDADLSGVVVRDIQPNQAGSAGEGIFVRNDRQTNERSSVRVTASVIERARTSGVIVVGSDAVLTGVVVRNTQLDESSQLGSGIGVENDSQANERGNLRVTASVIEQTRAVGISISGSDADLSGIVVRDVQPDEAGNKGVGIVVELELDPDKKERGYVQVTASVVERVHDAGVFVSGSNAELSGVVLRDVRPSGDVTGGRGIRLENTRNPIQRASMQVTTSVIEQTHGFGVTILGSDAELSAIVVRDIQPNDAGQFGRGIHIQNDLESIARASVHIMASLIERSQEAGVLIFQSDATIEGSIVRATLANEDGVFGDGITVWSLDGTDRTTINGTIIDSNARAGLGSYGASTRFVSTVLSCNAFDLEGEVYKDSPFAFPDSQNNLCGCPAVADSCSAVSAGLSPPSSLEPDPSSSAPGP